MMKPIYDPFDPRTARRHYERRRARRTIALYLYEMFVLIVVVGALIAVAHR